MVTDIWGEIVFDLHLNKEQKCEGVKSFLYFHDYLIFRYKTHLISFSIKLKVIISSLTSE